MFLGYLIDSNCGANRRFRKAGSTTGREQAIPRHRPHYPRYESGGTEDHMPTEAGVADEAATGEGRRRSRRPSDNERKACDAVVRALEKLAGSRRTNAHSPEDLGAQAQVEIFG